MVEINLPVGHFHHRILRVGQVRFLIQDFADPSDTGHGHTDHNDHHGEHHQAHKQRHNITEQTGQVTSGKRTAYNKLRSQPGYRDDTEINCHHHSRRVEKPAGSPLSPKGPEAFWKPLQTSHSHALPDKCLYHPDGGDIFLYAGVQVIVPAEHFPEDLKRYHHDSSDHDHQEDHRDQEHSAQVGADDQAHGEN